MKDRAALPINGELNLRYAKPVLIVFVGAHTWYVKVSGEDPVLRIDRAMIQPSKLRWRVVFGHSAPRLRRPICNRSSKVRGLQKQRPTLVPDQQAVAFVWFRKGKG